MIIEKACLVCKKRVQINVDKDAYETWTRGEGYLINLMPQLTVDEREILISSICGTCYDIVCGDDEPDPSEPYRDFEDTYGKSPF